MKKDMTGRKKEMEMSKLEKRPRHGWWAEYWQDGDNVWKWRLGGGKAAKKPVCGSSLYLKWPNDRGGALWWRWQQLPWIFYSGLLTMTAERHKDISHPCFSETSLLLAPHPHYPPTPPAAVERKAREEIKVKIVFRKGANRKLVQGKLCVFMALSKMFWCWELLWWMLGNEDLMDEHCCPMLWSD